MMLLIAHIGLLALPDESQPAEAVMPKDPWERTEWQLVSDSSIFGESDSWTGGFLPHEPPETPPLHARDWSYAAREICDDYAGPLARWILDPDRPSPERTKGLWLDAPDPSTVLVFAHTTITSPTEEARLARMPGVEWLLLNGELFVGDPLRRGFGGVPVLVARGTNRLFVKARDSKFEVVFEKPMTRLVIEDQDVRWPGGGGSPEIFPDADSWGVVSFPVFNVSSTPVSRLHHHYGKPTMWNETCRPYVSEWRDGGQIEPLGMFAAWHYGWNFDAECDSNAGKSPRDLWLPEALFDEGDKIETRKVLRIPLDPKKRAGNNVTNVQHFVGTVAISFAGNTDCAMLLEGTLNRASDYDGLARFHQQSAWYHSGRMSARYDDTAYPTNLWGSGPKRAEPGPTLAILGNQDTFKGWNNFIPDEPNFRARNGAVMIEGVEYTGDDLAGWSVVRSPKRTVRIHFDTGARGARLALLLTATWKGAVPDTAVFRIDPGEPRGWRRLEVPRSK